jgi:hypothetical protein
MTVTLPLDPQAALAATHAADLRREATALRRARCAGPARTQTPFRFARLLRRPLSQAAPAACYA